MSARLLTGGLLLFLAGVGRSSDPLYCYQCNKTDTVPCPQDSLLPCPISKDRCVTHITKDATNGFKIRRECGLGPCDFEDEMMNRGLGMDKCDKSKEEYFCVFCCKENGCNRDAAATSASSFVSLLSILALHAWALLLAHYH